MASEPRGRRPGGRHAGDFSLPGARRRNRLRVTSCLRPNCSFPSERPRGLSRCVAIGVPEIDSVYSVAASWNRAGGAEATAWPQAHCDDDKTCRYLKITGEDKVVAVILQELEKEFWKNDQ